jgi:uncharacterized membrane protein (UPF0136 family)
MQIIQGRESTMSMGVFAAITYGVLATMGGIIGYAQAQSKPSLVSGLLSGLLLIVGGVLWYRGMAAGVGLSLGVTIALVVIFIRRWLKTRKVMPALMMIAAGGLAFLVMVISLAR